MAGRHEDAARTARARPFGMAGLAARRYPRGVTHAELRSRLRAYADGTLDGSDLEIVRAHLASGCPDCLREVFTRPPGLPRPPVVVRRTPWGPVVIAALGAAAVGAGVATIVGTSWDRRPSRDDAAVASLAVEVERLRAEQASERRARLEAADPPVAAPATGLAPTPATTARPDADEAPPDDDEVPPWLAELLTSDGARVMQLEAAPTAPGARGYMVWSPARGVVVVSAAALPTTPTSAVYRVRVTLHDGSTVWVGDLPAPERDPLVVTVEMPDGGGRVTAVDLFRDPPGTPALSAKLRS
jgi:hypothetical protein